MGFLKKTITSVLLVLFLFSCAQPALQQITNQEVPEVTSRSFGSERPLSETDEWITETNIYQVYVDRFASNLDGVTAKIDYLQRIGVKTIWLMPIFEAMSDHGYNTTDYYKVANQYGTNQDLKELVQAAHAADIRVVLDLVINHCGTEHPWFASSDSNIRKDNWFVWTDSDWGWDDSWNNTASGYYPGATFFKDPYPHYDRNGNGDPWDDDYYFSLFGDSGGTTMPDLNFNDESAKNQIIDEIDNIMQFWIDSTGVDGFRCDAARYLAEEGQGKQADRVKTHEIWQEIRARLSAHAPGAILLAESPTQNYNQMLGYYGLPYYPNDYTSDPNDGELVTDGTFNEEFHSAFHFNYQGSLIAAARDSWWPSNLFTDLYKVQSHLPDGTQDSIFLSNHDSFAGARVATQMGNDTNKMKMAASLYLSLSGNPTIYYGEEYGMQNGPGEHDEPIRGNMDWGAVEYQESDSSSMVNHYRRLLTLRNGYDALRGGISYFTPVHDGSSWNSISSGGKIVAYTREWYGEMVVVIHNFSDETINAHLDLTSGGALNIISGTNVSSLMGQGSFSDITTSTESWYSIGDVYGKTTKMLFLGDISGYTTAGKFLTYENALDGEEVEEDWYYRGSSNNWGVTKMTYNETTNLYELVVTFSADDTNPRFKISASGDESNWNEAYPAQDYLITEGVGTYLIQFRSSDKSVLTPVKQIDGYSISGTILKDGTGLAGVSVTFGNFSATTNTNGGYSITNIPEGTSASLTPNLSGYTFTPQSIDLTVSNDILDQDFTGQGGTTTGVTIHYREWQYAQNYSVHTWNGLSGDYVMQYEGEFGSDNHWWMTSYDSVPDTFSFCFKNSNENWDGVNRHYDRDQHGDEIYIIYGDDNIYTSRD